MSNYHLADTKAQWFEDNYPGSVMKPNVVVLHTTEGTGWDDYQGGAIAPNMTGRPNMKAKRIEWRAHFPDERSSRALVNAPGGTETNTLNDVQVELVGTCDVNHRTHWGSLKAGVDYIYWPEAPEWALRDVAEMLADQHNRHGLKLQAPKVWLAYGPDPRRPGITPAAYGADNGSRMTAHEWQNFYGVCGHQHVPENLHGDPGAFPIDAVLGYVHDLVDPKPAPKPAPTPAPAPAPKPATPSRVSTARAALLEACDQLDQAWKAGPRDGAVKTLAVDIRKLANQLPKS